LEKTRTKAKPGIPTNRTNSTQNQKNETEYEKETETK
jgi:hypothetical protein